MFLKLSSNAFKCLMIPNTTVELHYLLNHPYNHCEDKKKNNWHKINVFRHRKFFYNLAHIAILF